MKYLRNNNVSVKELFKACDSAIEMYFGYRKEAEEHHDVSKVAWCDGAIEALNWLKRDFGFPKRLDNE